MVMAIGRGGRGPMSLLLAVNFVASLIVLGLSSWSIDKYINGEQNHPHLGGNESTSYLLMFAVVAGVLGMCSVVAGLVHFCAWSSDSMACASSLALLSWAAMALGFGLVCKQIALGGHRGRRLQRKPSW